MNTIMLSENTYRCRLCLKVSSDVINIFREDFPKMIKLLTTIQVEQTDDLPKVACFTCTRKVKSAMNIRKQIIRSHRTLMEEALAKKIHSYRSDPTKIKCKYSLQSYLDKKTSNSNDEVKVVAPEIILLKNKSDFKMEQEIVIDNLESESNKNKRITNEPNKKNIQNLSMMSLNKNEISIVKINKSIVGEPKVITTNPVSIKNRNDMQILKRRGAKPLMSNPLINTNVQVHVRRNTKLIFKPGLSGEPPKRRGPKPKQSTSKYNPLTPIPCKICQKLIQRTNMKKHVETHDKKIVTCHLCGKITKNTSLRAHIFYFHKCKEDQYICDQCGRHFRYRNKFKLHMKKEHGGTKDFECTICGRKFFERKYLTKHIDCHHKKIRPFICDYCGKNFSTKHALKVHLRQHTENAPYNCVTCGQRFKQNVSLKTHRKQAHDICEKETVFCEVCGKGFASTVALSSHFRLHERKKCIYCSEVFVRDDYLERHMKDKHGTLNSEEIEIEAEKVTIINQNDDVI